MTSEPKQLQQVSELTLANYDSQAAAFWQGTRDHDVTQKPWLASVWRKPA